jgi:hypothetical protein
MNIGGDPAEVIPVVIPHVRQHVSGPAFLAPASNSIQRKGREDLKRQDLSLARAKLRAPIPASTPKVPELIGTASRLSVAHGDISNEEIIVPFQFLPSFPVPLS